MEPSRQATQARLTLQASALEVPWQQMPADVVRVVDALRPVLDRCRRGEWRLLVTGPRTARERQDAVGFTARLLDLADALEARR